jgi:hypothetical protein
VRKASKIPLSLFLSSPISWDVDSAPQLRFLHAYNVDIFCRAESLVKRELLVTMSPTLEKGGQQ